MLNLNFQNGQAPALNARNMNAIVEAINTILTQLGSPFVFKGDILYENLPAAGNTINDTYYVIDKTCLYTWDGDSWEVSSLSESDYLAILNQVESGVSSLVDGVKVITGNKPGIFRPGYYQTWNPDDPEYSENVIDLENPSQLEGFVCCYFPCNQGDVFYTNLYGTTTGRRAWAILNSERKVVLRGNTNSYLTGPFTITPETAAYVIFNNSVSNNEDYYAISGSIPLKSIVSVSRSTIDSVYGKKMDVIWEPGAINGATGENRDGGTWNDYRRTAEKIPYLESTIIAQDNNNMPTSARVYFYDENNTFVNASGELMSGVIKVSDYAPPSASNFRLSIRLISTDYSWDDTNLNDYVFVGNSENSLSGKILNGDRNPGTFLYNGATVAILGDSISTSGDWSQANPLGNVPEIVVQNEDVGVQLSAYATYYDVGTTIGGYTITSGDIGTEITFTPTTDDVGKAVGVPKNHNSNWVPVWWKVCRNILNFTPIPVCWSGSSVTSHESNKSAYKTSYAWHDAQIRKCGIRTPGTMDRVAPDVIIIERGGNDMTHQPYTRLTNNYFGNYPWTFPDSDVMPDGNYSFFDGLSLTIKKLREAYPETVIVLCTINYLKRINTDYPTRNGFNTLEEYNNAIRDVANHFGCKLIEFDKDGLNFFNATNKYYSETDAPYYTHPNSYGHKMLANRALIDLAKVNMFNKWN